MGHIERRTSDDGACAVCGAKDARTLSYTRLDDGQRVVVCGSHKIAHRRAERLARSIDDLRDMLRERRAG